MEAYPGSSAPFAWGYDSELLKVADMCLESREKVSFVVGPPRCGKSTRLPAMMARPVTGSVICVEPDADTAARHAKYARAALRGKILYVDDVNEPSSLLGVEYDVAYVSYKWLLRLIAARISPEAKVRCPVSVIVLDEVHAETLDQELGHVAVGAVLEGIVGPPPGWSDGTKIVLMTAFPEADPFGQFGLSGEQVRDRTFTVAAAGDRAPAESTYLEDDGDGSLTSPAGYHEAARRIVESVLLENGQANVLVVVLGGPRAESHVVREMTVGGGARLFDLSRSDVREVNDRGPGGCVIVAEPDYASGIPVEGITDVVCPQIEMRAGYRAEVSAAAAAAAPLCRWQVDFVRGHLDPRAASRTIHHAFTRDAARLLPAANAARCLDGECLEYWLGLARLLGTGRAQESANSARYVPGEATTLSAFKTLSEELRLLTFVEEGPVANLRPRDGPRTKLSLDLMDTRGLGCREAAFLTTLATVERGDGEGFGSRCAALALAVMMVVFRRSPVLSRADPSKPARLADLSLSLPLSARAGSDPLINAEFWMKWADEVEERGFDALPPLAGTNWRVDRHSFSGAAAAVRKLGHVVGAPGGAWSGYVEGRSSIGEVAAWLGENAAKLDYVADVYMSHCCCGPAIYVGPGDVDGGLVGGWNTDTRQSVKVDTRYLCVDVEAALKDRAGSKDEGVLVRASHYEDVGETFLAQGISMVGGAAETRD
ncbi:hypothetical protein F4781DRAFT_390183 [Annulohypoxylon bovei var. microspora]|nr:hypothetical protein F4781DRAFT_390183 [Annulohypoxylon bovei var. microspora]